MPDQIKFELVSPERLLVSQNVDGVVVPGADGEFTALAHHAPLMSTINPGVIRVLGGGEDKSRFFVRGGFAEITPEGLTILAEEAIPLEKLDAVDLDQRIKDLEEDVRDAKDDETRLKASDELAHLKQVRGAL